MLFYPEKTSRFKIYGHPRISDQSLNTLNDQNQSSTNIEATLEIDFHIKNIGNHTAENILINYFIDGTDWHHQIVHNLWANAESGLGISVISKMPLHPQSSSLSFRIVRPSVSILSKSTESLSIDISTFQILFEIFSTDSASQKGSIYFTGHHFEHRHVRELIDL